MKKIVDIETMTIEEKNNFKDIEGFDLSFVIEELQKIPNAAKEKINNSKKRPIILIEDYLNTTIKNDPLLVKRLLRVCFSAYTDEPINCILLSPTSEGKTYSTVQVSEIFPTDDVISIGRLSPTALIHQYGELVDPDGYLLKERLEKLELDIFNAESEQDKKSVHELKQIKTDMMKTARNLVDLTHKIILFLDNPSPQTYEMLKPIMSHDKKEILYKTTKSDGSLSVKETIIRGWPATIICSAKNEAKNEVWAEVASREIILSPNTDVSKYHAANKLTSQKMGIPSILENNNNEKSIIKFYVERLKSSLVKLCADGNPIVNPFYEMLADSFPHNEGITMRHFKRLLSFVNIETLVNANSNMKIEFKINEKKEKKFFVVASIKMIEDAIKILGNISTTAPEKIKFYNEIFLPLIKEKSTIQILHNEDPQRRLIDASDNITVTKEEVAEKFTKVFHKMITPKSIQENYLKQLSDEGILDWKKNEDNKKQYLYFLSSKLSIHNLTTVVRQLNDRHDKDFLYVWSCLVKPFQLSCKMGKMIRIFDNSNPNITYLEFEKKISGSILDSHDNSGDKND